MNICWIDIETTGLNPKIDKIVELAAIIEKDNNIITSYQEYIKYPDYPINSKDAFNINGLSEKFLEKHGINFDSAISDIEEFLFYQSVYKEEKLIIAGYCIDFDISFLKNYFQDIFNNVFDKNIIDVKKIADSYLINNKIKLVNKKLETVCNYFNIKQDFHSAMPDVIATKELYYKLINKDIKK